MPVDKSIIRRLDESGVPLLGVRLLLGVLFVYTGWAKVGHPFDFLKQIHQYGALPETPAIFLNSVAIVLPWLEIIAGTALILGIYRRGAAATIAIMFVAFTPAIFLRAMAIRAAQGTPFFEIVFDCGCGTGVVIIWKKLLTNGGLLLLSGYALFSRSQRFTIGTWISRHRATAGQCRGCGNPLEDGQSGLCNACSESSPIPAGAADGARECNVSAGAR